MIALHIRATDRASATDRARATDRGSATIELAILAPALLAVLGLVIVAGRISTAGSAVEQAAVSAARAASIARDARAAQAGAERAVRDSLRDQGVTCQPLTSSVDVTGFAIAVGSPSSVTVSVRCALPLADVAVPGMPGQRTVTARMTSPLDRFRGRS
ncbi:MAG TPA: TadE/TadG family type IV pilus assembly protein [Candidatus Limnocylindrales bacterium]|nr:TadE/TadG family type IV pilus assembly protein [Candidatus Limnocylindrales bacterium]